MLSVLFFFGCSQSIYLTNTDELKQVIYDELLESKVIISLKDSTHKDVYLHNVQQDTLITVGYDRKDENTVIDKILLNDIKDITHQQEGPGLAGLIIGLSQGMTTWDFAGGLYGIAGLIIPALTIVPAGMGWFIGSATDINKIYRLEAQTVPQFYVGARIGTSFSFIKEDNTNLNTQSNISRDIGLFYDYNFNAFQALQFNFSYLNTGAQWEKNVDYAYYDLSSLLSSIIYKTNYPFSGFNSKAMFCIGAYHEYNLRARQEWLIEDHFYAIDTNNDSPPIPGDFSDEINKNMFGTILGMQLPFFFDEWRCQLLWYYSVTELYKDNYPRYRGDFANKSNFHKNMFIFSMDYLFY